MTDVLNEQELAGKEVSRTSFLKGGAALAVGMSVAGSLLTGKASAVDDPTAPNPAHRGTGPTGDPRFVDTWLQFNTDNTVTLYAGWNDVGQGTPVTVAMIVADELEMAITQIKYAALDTFNADLQPSTNSTGTFAAFGSTAVGGSTNPSTTVAAARAAAAAAKRLLLSQAGHYLNTVAGNLSVSWGVVKDSSGHGSVSYGTLMGGKLFASTQTFVPAFTGTIATAGATAKTLNQTDSYSAAAALPAKVVGVRLKPPALKSMVAGKYPYIQDVTVTGMIHGRIVRPKGQAAYGQGATVVSIDPTSVAAIPGVKVVQVKNFVGVTAPIEADAVKAAAQLKVTWDNTPKLPSSGNLAKAMRNNPISLSGFVRTDTPGSSNASQVLTSTAAAQIASASFFWPYQSNNPVATSCAIADMKATTGTIYCTNQGVNPAAKVAAISGSYTAAGIRVMTYPASGGAYGHAGYDDASIAAAIMSMTVAAPVRVLFDRSDELGWDSYGPAFLCDIQAGISLTGKITAYQIDGWIHSNVVGEVSPELSQAITADTSTTGGSRSTLPTFATPATLVAQGPSGTTAGMYTIPAQRSNCHGLSFNGMLRGGALRGQDMPQGLFAAEQIIDMLAYQAKLDPIYFRLFNMTSTAGIRIKPLFDALRSASHYSGRPAASKLGSGNVVTGRGVACGVYQGTYVAVLAKVSVNKSTGKISVTDIYGAQDNGLTINPASLDMVLQTNLVQGVSRALCETVTFSKVRVTSLDYSTYKVLRAADTPKVHTINLPQTIVGGTAANGTINPPTGASEPLVGPVAAAVANAFFDATGLRAFKVPMNPGYIKSLVKEAAAGRTPARVGGY